MCILEFSENHCAHTAPFSNLQECNIHPYSRGVEGWSKARIADILAISIRQDPNRSKSYWLHVDFFRILFIN